MATATLTFQIPEEQNEFDVAVSGNKLAAAIFEFQNFMRGEMKHGSLSDNDYAIYEKLRDKLTESLDSWGVSEILG